MLSFTTTSLSIALTKLLDMAGDIASVGVKALLIFMICRIAMNLIMKAVNRLFEKISLESGIKGFVRSVIQIALWAVTVIIVAESVGIKTASLVAVLSVASLALSLSVQNILTDAFSGVTILMSQPFKVGQFVEIAGVSGTVSEISIMRTTLETPDNKQVLIPNAEITNSKIINYTSEPIRRVDLFFSASYDAPTALVKQALYEAIAADERILQDPAPFVGIESYDANDIRYVTKSWCASGDYWGVYYTLNERVRDVYEKHGIEFSYPHVVVHTENK